MHALSATEKSYFRWIIVSACFTLLVVLRSPYTGLGVFFPVIAQEFGWQRGAVSAVLSAMMILGAPVGLVLGGIIDRRGPRLVMLAEVVLCGAGVALAATVQSLWELYLYLGLILGLGFSGTYIVPTTTAARWFSANRGLGIGIVLCGGGMAYFVGPTLAVGLIEGFGWRGAFFAMGLTMVLVGLLPAAVLRNPPLSPASPPAAGTGAEPELPGVGASRQVASTLTFRRILGTSTFWMLWTIWLFQAYATIMFVVHVVPLVADKGHALTLAAGALSVYGLGSLVGRMLAGPLSDRFGARSILAAGMFAAALGLVVLLITPDLTLIFVCTFTFGLGLASADTSYMRALPDIVGTRLLGSVMSGLNVGFRMGAATGPALAGYIFDLTGAYAVPFSLGAVGLAASVGLFVVATRVERRLERMDGTLGT